MKCSDHPTIEAVAIIKSEGFNVYIGLCDYCYKRYKEYIIAINKKEE